MNGLMVLVLIAEFSSVSLKSQTAMNKAACAGMCARYLWSNNEVLEFGLNEAEVGPTAIRLCERTTWANDPTEVFFTDCVFTTEDPVNFAEMTPPDFQQHWGEYPGAIDTTDPAQAEAPTPEQSESRIRFGESTLVTRSDGVRVEAEGMTRDLIQSIEPGVIPGVVEVTTNTEAGVLDVKVNEDLIEILAALDAVL